MFEELDTRLNQFGIEKPPAAPEEQIQKVAEIDEGDQQQEEEQVIPESGEAEFQAVVPPPVE
jgi:preprotein translocase subunit SecD